MCIEFSLIFLQFRILTIKSLCVCVRETDTDRDRESVRACVSVQPASSKPSIVFLFSI